jgi:hypothetical protein
MARLGGRLTCENCVAIDVRELKRRGLLRPARGFPCLGTVQVFPVGTFRFALSPTHLS